MGGTGDWGPIRKFKEGTYILYKSFGTKREARQAQMYVKGTFAINARIIHDRAKKRPYGVYVRVPGRVI